MSAKDKREENPLMTKLINLMRTAREKKGLNQKDISKQLNIHSTTISSWERGNSEFSIDEFMKYCEICGVSGTDLLKEVYGDPTEPLQTIECTAGEADMIRKFRYLDGRAQRVILRNLEAEYLDAQKIFAEESSTRAGAG